MIKQNAKQMLPVALIISITIIMSLFLYQRVMVKEKENCWKLLEDSAGSVTKEMQITFTDDINVLHLAANMLEQHPDDEINVKELELYRSNTTFSRVDVIYPGNILMLEDGTQKDLRSELSFDAIAKEGEHMSARMIDTETGRSRLLFRSH